MSRTRGNGPPRLSVVLPAFQEADRIVACLETLRAELADVEASGGLELVVVDDGSTDATATLARDAGADTVLTLSPNRGKGAAVRSGVAAATGATVAFTDVDLAYPPGQLRDLLDRIEGGADAAVGSRITPESVAQVRASPVRQWGGRLVGRLASMVLLRERRDTQCGLKAFRADVASDVFASARVDGFAFDIEILHLLERRGARVVEVPVTVVNRPSSSVRVVRDGLRLALDVVAIRIRAWRGGYD